MPGDITLLDKNGVLYIVTRGEPSLAHISPRVTSLLTGNQDVERVVLTGQSELFSSHTHAVKCDKTSCLNRKFVLFQY